MKNWSKVLGGSGQPAPIEKDRHALPPPVNPFPRPEEIDGPRFGSGSYKQILRNRQAKLDRARVEAENLKPDEFIGGLSSLAHSIAKKLGITLSKPTAEITYRQTARFPAAIANSRIVGQVTAQLILDCAKTAKIQLATPDELAELRKLAANWDATHRRIMDVCPTSERVHEIIAADQARAGTAEFLGLQPDDARQRCMTELTPLKNKLSDISLESASIAKAILPRALEAVSISLGLSLEAEIKLAEKQRMPFVQSVFANTLMKLQEALGAQDLTSPGQYSPRDFLIGLPGLLMDESKEAKTK